MTILPASPPPTAASTTPRSVFAKTPRWALGLMTLGGLILALMVSLAALIEPGLREKRALAQLKKLPGVTLADIEGIEPRN